MPIFERHLPLEVLDIATDVRSAESFYRLTFVGYEFIASCIWL